MNTLTQCSLGRDFSGVRRRRSLRSFSLIELLIVIGVMLALVAVTLPAFRSLKDSMRQSGGKNAVSAALNTARALAMREGRDVAAMFKFDVTSRVCSIELLVLDSTVDDSGLKSAASVFVPIEGHAPIELPEGAGVFGYGFGSSRGSSSNEQNWYADLGLLYPVRNTETRQDDPWLFPRTDPLVFGERGKLTTRDVEFLDTFIVRFSPDGTVVTNAEELGSSARGGNGYVELNFPGEKKFRVWDPHVEIDPISNLEHAIAEIQLRSAPFLVVVDLFELASSTGIARPWMVLGPDHPRDTGEKRSDANGNGIDDQLEIDEWIASNATVIAFNRYSGTLMGEYRR